jgi:ribosomal protein S18 acetylase RimI-like enzyme
MARLVRPGTAMPDALPPPFRRATAADAPALARLYALAGFGLPLVVWADWARPGETALDVGARLIAAPEGEFTHTQAIVADEGAGPVGCLLGWRLEGEPGPPSHPLYAPHAALAAMVQGAWYLDVLAVAESAQGRRLGSALLALAEGLARDSGAAEIALDVSDANPRAQALYRRAGYIEKARIPYDRTGWDGPWREMLLMTKAL